MNPTTADTFKEVLAALPQQAAPQPAVRNDRYRADGTYAGPERLPVVNHLTPNRSWQTSIAKLVWYIGIKSRRNTCGHLLVDTYYSEDGIKCRHSHTH